MLMFILGFLTFPIVVGIAYVIFALWMETQV